ncbi:MAG: ribosomal RNA small subunit methyltransferase A [Acidobacteria bacterium 37-71-11]|nr:MAG: ribosomal RNA small subunit methyltransferase A [Acidobacteria bacterium 37-71-11]
MTLNPSSLSGAHPLRPRVRVHASAAAAAQIPTRSVRGRRAAPQGAPGTSGCRYCRQDRTGVATVRTRRQRLGQHFLRDAATARAIAAALAGDPPRVLEIGPGRGALTGPLLERFGHVRAVELDGALAAGLARRLGDPPGLEVRHADALADDLDALAAGGPWQVAANLPYSVGTAIVRRLLPRRDLFALLVVMVQLEVAQRMVAPPGGRNRGLMTLETEAYGRAEILFTVPPGRFAPPPKVNSAVVRIGLRPDPAPAAAIERGLSLASLAFAQRRKKIANPLAAAAAPAGIAAACAAAGVDPGARPQELAWDAWLALGRAIAESGAAGRHGEGRA